ncbi:hypothetical protein [Idiomarina sp.]|uniref:hypothetical protein n=1 Tax=Idiomarina sp. TaxID=1874361 RepID=UPI0025881241|nr:hypothetical protein [Idiomarina sp.]
MRYKQKISQVPSRLAINGKQLYIIEADYPVKVDIRGLKDGSEWSLETTLTSGLGANLSDYSRFGDGATSVELSSDIEQTIVFWSSFADITDNRTDGLKVSLTGATEIQSGVESVTDAAAVSLVPVTPARRRVTFQVQGGTAYIGGAGVTAATGFEVGAGSTFEISSTAAFYAIAKAGETPEVRILEELN